MLQTRLILTCALSLCAFTLAKAADAPQFDRPGIAFSTATVPRGSVSFEQGLPDFERSSDAGVSTRAYSADTNVRVGLSDSLEVQVAAAAFNYVTTRSQGIETSSRGSGDSSIALKVALPSNQPRLSWAALGSVTFASGARDFTAGAPTYDLGTTVSLQIADNASTAFYVDLTRFRDETTWTVSPSFSYSVTDTVGTFVEAGASHSRHDPDVDVAGGGFTWMITPVVQLDLAADFGLNRASPHVQGGFGVAVFLE